MFLAQMVNALLGQLMHRDLDDLNERIFQVENRTGYHSWEVGSYGISSGDFGDLSANMTAVKSLLAFHSRVTKIVREIQKFISTSSKEWEGSVQSTECNEFASALNNHNNITEMWLKMQEIQIDYLNTRTDAQLTAVYAYK